MTKVAIITGASRGIDAATPLRLASDGFDIGVNYLTNQNAANRVVEIAHSLGDKASAEQANISSERQVSQQFQETIINLAKPSG